MKAKATTMLPFGSNVFINDPGLHPRDVSRAVRRALRKHGGGRRINVAGTPRQGGRKAVVLATPHCEMGLLVLHLQHLVAK